LVRELETYEPPVLYRAQLTPRAEVVALPGAGDFEAEAAKLRELRMEAEKSLLAPAAAESFLSPEPGRAERLKPAATDSAAAEMALADGFPLEDLEILALLRNAGALAKERELRASLAGYGQVENLDSILRRYSAFTASLMTGIGGMESPEAAALKFPFPGVLALKGQVVTQDARAAREQLEAARRKAVTAARKAYWELLFTRRAQETMGQMLDLLEHLKAAASARYAAGETSFQDVVKVGIEREKAREALRTMEEDQKNMEAMVREALDLPPSARIGAPADRDADSRAPAPGELNPVALQRRQELRSMRAMVGKMERMLEMSETMIYPGFSLNLSLYERDEVSRVGGGGGMGGERESFPTATTASMGEGVPKMPWFGTQDAYLGELRQRIEALKNDLRMEEASTMLGVRQAWFRLDKARRERALFADRVVSLSQAALEASNRGYSAGKVMFADVIESYTGWLEANLALARSRADVGVGRAELEDAVGTSLRR
jgi:outer membrane protein TolC